MSVKRCFITAPIFLPQNTIVTNLKLWRSVTIENNKILDAIMSIKDNWKKMPIFWIDDRPYFVQVIAENEHGVVMWQVFMKTYYDPKIDKQCYYIANKRQVFIQY